LYDSDRITPDARESYPGACIPCIHKYIDWFVQHKVALLDAGVSAASVFLSLKDEWEVETGN
jgi:hypothetical protein